MAGSGRFRTGVVLAAALALAVATAPAAGARVPAEDVHVVQLLTIPPGTFVQGSSPALPAFATSMTTRITTEKEDEAAAAVDMLVQLAMLDKEARLLTCSLMALRANAIGQGIGAAGDPAAALAVVKTAGNAASACFQVVSVLQSIGELQSPQIDTRGSRCAQASVTVPVATTSEGISVTGAPLRKKPALRISCRDSGGAMVVKVKPRSKKQTLRKVVGDRLTFGFSSPAGTTTSIPVKVAYGNPR